jgi:hypothetical protein
MFPLRARPPLRGFTHPRLRDSIKPQHAVLLGIEIRVRQLLCEHRGLQLGVCRPRTAVHPLAFQRGVKCLADGTPLATWPSV